MSGSEEETMLYMQQTTGAKIERILHITVAGEAYRVTGKTKQNVSAEVWTL